MPTKSAIVFILKTETVAAFGVSAGACDKGGQEFQPGKTDSAMFSDVRRFIGSRFKMSQLQVHDTIEGSDVMMRQSCIWPAPLELQTPKFHKYFLIFTDAG
jgi:hypothetical protein